MQHFSFKEAVEQHGLKNLLFKFEVDCFDKTSIGLLGILGFGFTSSGQNTSSECFVIDESRYKISENYKIGFTNLEQNIAVPNQTFYISDFESRVNNGHASVYAITPDGTRPLFVTLVDVATDHDLKVIECVEDNFFLLQPFLGEMKTDWN